MRWLLGKGSGMALQGRTDKGAFGLGSNSGQPSPRKTVNSGTGTSSQIPLY